MRRYTLDLSTPGAVRILNGIERAGTFLIATTASILLSMGSLFPPYMGTALMSAGLVAVLFIVVIRYERLCFAREHCIYMALCLYMLIAMLWTDNNVLAINTLVPALNFLLAITIFSTLTAYDDSLSAINGFFVGLFLTVTAYVMLTGYPLNHPSWYSYNAVAFVFLFALFLTSLIAGYQRFRWPFFAFFFLFLALLVATTSIKANLGLALGVIFMIPVFYRECGRLILRYWLPVLLIFSVAAFFTLSNAAAVDRIASGLDRIALGVQILLIRDDIAGYSAFDSRTQWVTFGLKQWLSNPIFGHGVEALRDEIGITSHTTVVDLLYNFGLIGLVLFYSIFLSIVHRLRTTKRCLNAHVRPLIFAALVCFMFATLSATMFTHAILAAVTGISIGLLRDSSKANRRENL